MDKQCLKKKKKTKNPHPDCAAVNMPRKHKLTLIKSHCHKNLNKQKISQFVLLAHQFWNYTHCGSLHEHFIIDKRPEILEKFVARKFYFSETEWARMPKILFCIPTLSRLLNPFVSFRTVPLPQPSVIVFCFSVTQPMASTLG